MAQPERHPGSKNTAKRNWVYGRTDGSIKKQMRDSIRRHKKELNRQIRHLPVDDEKAVFCQKCFYKHFAKDKAYSHVD